MDARCTPRIGIRFHASGRDSARPAALPNLPQAERNIVSDALKSENLQPGEPVHTLYG
jgi:hypothetical protein